jgi:hypothetical protein
LVGRLRAAELERRLVAVVAPALRAVVALAAAPFAALALAGVLRVVLVDLARLGAALADAVEPPDESSSVHLPDRTRCAASATASAISEPSRDALLTIVVAAALALSAASIPASRIARRALGLAAIAAAAAVSPAASISRLMAALAILSKLALADDSPLLEPLSPPPPFEDDLDIAASLLMTFRIKDGPAPKRFRCGEFRAK